MNIKKVILNVLKVTAIGGACAAALTGCCMLGSDKGCCEKGCCERKTHGVNASTTVGIGTGGVHVGGDANVGGHGVSGNMGGTAH